MAAENASLRVFLDHLENHLCNSADWCFVSGLRKTSISHSFSQFIKRKSHSCHDNTSTLPDMSRLQPCGHLITHPEYSSHCHVLMQDCVYWSHWVAKFGGNVLHKSSATLTNTFLRSLYHVFRLGYCKAEHCLGVFSPDVLPTLNCHTHRLTSMTPLACVTQLEMNFNCGTTH